MNLLRTSGVCFALALVVACKRSASSGGAEKGAGAKPSAAHSAVAPLPSLVSAKPAACRALRVRGAARGPGGPLAEMAPLEGREWLTLEPGAEVVVRHGTSAREFSVKGPGQFLPCRGGLEQVLIDVGSFKSGPGTGVRPGGEVLVATPFGTASYGDGDLDVTVDEKRLRIVVRRGHVTTQAAPGSAGLPDNGVHGPDGSAVATGVVDPAAVVAGCEGAAKDAKASAERLLAAQGHGEVGKAAAAQLLDRRRARALCASAEASTARATDPALKGRLESQVIAAERAWRTVPTRPSPGPNTPAR